MPRARCPPRPLVLTGPCDSRMDLLSKHHVPDDDTLDSAADRWWLGEISRSDTTIDTPRHLFWGGMNPDADDSPTVDFTLLTRERDESAAADEGVLASVIPLRPEAEEPGDALPAAGSRMVPARRGGRKLRRPVLVGAAALACVLTVLAGTSSAQSKHVALVVDGQTRYVDTSADTVTAVLASAGVNVGAHDSLAPAGSAAISDGSTIVLNRGQQLTVNIGGQAEQIWTTTTEAAAIEQAAAHVVGAAPAPAATATPPVQTAARVPVTLHDSAPARTKVSTSVTAGPSAAVAQAVKAAPPKVTTAPSTRKSATPPKASAVVTTTPSAAGTGIPAANAVLGTVTITDPNRQTANAQAIYEFFRNNGATAAGAAGITGNFIDESSTSPTAVNGAGFYGIEQWGGTRWDGPDSLNAFAADHGASWDDLHTQLEFSLFELGLTTWTDKSGTTHTPPSWVTPGGAVITDASITDPQAAALKFEEAAEGCEPADSCGLDVRQLAAQEVFDALKGYVPTGPNAGPSQK